MRADGAEQREFERDEQEQRDLDYVEALYDRADTHDLDHAQAAMVAHFIHRVLP